MEISFDSFDDNGAKRDKNPGRFRSPTLVPEKGQTLKSAEAQKGMYNVRETVVRRLCRVPRGC